MTAPAAEPIFVEQIRRGDERAWRDFIAAYQGRLTAFVRARLGDAATVDDVVQEAFIGFLVSLPNYDASRGLETYLFSIAAHKLTDHLRRTGRRPTVPLAAGDDSSNPGREPADSARSVGNLMRSGERRELEHEAIIAALTEVLSHWRAKHEWTKTTCCELLFVRGRANKEAAALLDITEQAVANTKFDFLARVRESLRRQKLSPEVFPELKDA